MDDATLMRVLDARLDWLTRHHATPAEITAAMTEIDLEEPA